MKKIYSFALALFATVSVNAQTLVYSNNFENGLNGVTVVGSGVIEANTTSGFGNVFHNAAGGQGIRTNYLLLPETVLAQSSTSLELTIGFWANKGTAANYYWSPIFSAYRAAPINGENTWPMMILQARMVAQVNCEGWTDLTDVQNVAGVNAVNTDWIDDGLWHYYAATYTATSVKIYIDGVIKNEWTLTGAAGSTVNGLFSNGGDLKYICLGGNQAWNWGDADPAFLYDDVSIYSNALTAEQISDIISAKPTLTTAINPISNENTTLVSEEYYTINGARAGNEFSTLKRGLYIKKTIFSNGSVKNSKIEKVID
jgi:hypothetical protein